MPAMGEKFNEYLPLVRDLARRALDLAERATQRVHGGGKPLTLALPAARALVERREIDPAALQPGLMALTESGGPGNWSRWDDAIGFSRPIYHPLVLHLHRRVAELHHGNERLHLSATAASVVLPSLGENDRSDLAISLWKIVCKIELVGGWPPPLERDVELLQRFLSTEDGRDGSLHAQHHDDLLDAWTYRELAGLHALWRLALLMRERSGSADAGTAGTCERRAHEAALFHVAHTQPDYTTYQPWALPAFLAFDDTRHFGEQQLHDVETHLAIDGPDGAVVPALLLADAVDAMTPRN